MCRFYEVEKYNRNFYFSFAVTLTLAAATPLLVYIWLYK